MARTPVRSLLLVAGLVAFGFRACSFVSGPTSRSPVATEGFLAVSTSAAVAALGAAPVFAEELPPDEIYNRKVLEAASYCLIFSAFLVGLVIFQARKLVENRWLN
mmetsp:Transcript_40697/g.73544  ORF Transcript_40697/g.73544 Transcript_40697/m.73544 type:complete len:105 (+) Transcript_40697:79-393(+)